VGFHHGKRSIKSRIDIIKRYNRENKMEKLTLEKRIEKLEVLIKNQQKISKSQELELARIEAAQAIENVINRYEYFSEAGRWDDVVALFALKTPGVRSEILNWGVYESAKGIKSLYQGIHKTDSFVAGGSNMKPGYFVVNCTTTPVIEVSRDGKTARGLWIVFGAAATPPTFESRWQWFKLAADFVKEKSAWKIWHYHLYGLFESTYYKSWAEPGQHFMSEAAPSIRIPSVSQELLPQRPTTHPLWWYTPASVNDPVPAPPEPYDTFDAKQAY
jgi:hypothetical protein